MILQTLQLENFGLYQGKHELHFVPHEKKPVTLIGGLNGRGKTTLLDAITLGLYGRRALKYLQDERIKYSTYLNNHINKNASYGSTTSITITLADSAQMRDVIVLRRSWEKRFKADPEELITATRNGVQDDYLSENWDYFVEEILPLNISRFFFFDNEKIAQIADDDTFNSVKESIRSLLGLTTIDQLVSDLEKISRKKMNSQDDAEHNKILKEIEKTQFLMDQCDRQAKEAYEKAGQYHKAVRIAREQLEEESDKFWKAGGNLGMEKEKLQKELQSLEENIHSLEARAMTILNDSASPLLLVSALMQRVSNQAQKNDEKIVRSISANVLTDLQNRLQTITGYSPSFMEEAQRFLAQARADLSDDSQTESYYQISPEAAQHLTELLSTHRRRLGEAIELIEKMKSDRESIIRVEMHLSREVNDQAAQELWQHIMQLNEEINQNEVNRRLEEERQARSEREREIYSFRRAKLVASTIDMKKSQGENERLMRYSQMVIQTMGIFKERLTEKRVNELSENILKCFQSMVGKASMIQKVQLDPKTLDLKLIDENGIEMLKSQLSAGEKQLFAISIIWGLAKCSGYQMPVIIDTPLGRLDSYHRANFVEGYLPYAGKQVVVLSTDEEIYGQYLERIKPYVNAAYTLVYDDKTRSTSIKAGYFGGVAV